MIHLGVALCTRNSGHSPTASRAHAGPAPGLEGLVLGSGPLASPPGSGQADPTPPPPPPGRMEAGAQGR